MSMAVLKGSREGRHPGGRYGRPPEDGPDSPLFAQGAPLRKMRVVLDAAVGASTAQDKLHLLLGLLTHPHIELYRYADDGPPADAPRRSIDWLGEVVPGWIALEETPESLRDFAVTYADEDGVAQGAVMAHHFMELARGDGEAVSYRELPAGVAATRRAADVLAARVVDAAHADVFITERSYLFEDRRFAPTRGITVLRPLDALPLIGLYLRQQGEYITWRSADGHGMATFNRGLFYWVATRALLPEGWRWMTACVRESTASGDDTLTFHAQSLLQRVDQALRARDEAFAALNAPQNNDTADDALAALDRLLLLLMAAVDVSARVAHMVLGLSAGDLYQASWKRGGRWERELRRHHRQLSDLTKSAAYGDVLAILRLLRNTVHGAALTPLAVSDGSFRGPTDTLVALPSADATTLLECADRQGGRAAWGMKELIPGQLHADIDVLIERLLPAVIGFLNEAMRLTPVERLLHANLTAADAAPAVSNDLDAFSELNRRLILWQLGLA
ncbi:hypothetical protein [Geodermatophilus sp. SYSU D01105]